jgi:pimeloyl-ACP methyl ester carboxylesterase
LLGFLPLTVVLVAMVGFLVFIAIRYSPIIGRIFEEKPLFLPLLVDPAFRGEEVRFPTGDGLELTGTYFPARTAGRIGVLVFCHEFLSDRWSCQPYADRLRDVGFDLFSFDFRNHGASAHDRDYQPLQWVTDRDVRDLRAALAYLRRRADRDPAGVGLFGVSRGGGTALVVAAEDPGVWGVVTDGAFPTRGTMLAYIVRWAEIYVRNPLFREGIPLWIYSYVGWVARVRSQSRLRCRFPSVERAAARLAPRPWLMIHGEKDAYIGPEIARRLFAEAREPKALWIVAEAKHNRCRELQPEVYAARVAEFFLRTAPRGAPVADQAAPVDLPMPYPHRSPVGAALAPIAGGVAAPLSG